MSEQDQIASLEAMLAEERDVLKPFLMCLEKYVRGLDLMARAAYMESPVGSRDEANAGAIKQHTGELLYWLDRRVVEIRSLMDRGMSADQDDAPSPGEEVEKGVVTIH